MSIYNIYVYIQYEWKTIIMKNNNMDNNYTYITSLDAVFCFFCILYIFNMNQKQLLWKTITWIKNNYTDITSLDAVFCFAYL